MVINTDEEHMNVDRGLLSVSRGWAFPHLRSPCTLKGLLPSLCPAGGGDIREYMQQVVSNEQVRAEPLREQQEAGLSSVNECQQ